VGTGGVGGRTDAAGSSREETHPDAGSEAGEPGGQDRVRARLDQVRDRIARAGGDPERISIVAVTKGQPLPAVATALAIGLRDLGENYAGELVAKAAAGVGPAGHEPPSWHLLGPIQRRSVPRLAATVGTWQTLSRPEEVDVLARRAAGATVLVQVELTGRPGRNGCAPERCGELVRRAVDSGLACRGLMTVAAPGPVLSARATFATLSRLADRLELPERSMGMSEDFEAAVAEGSTMVRLGTALFGPRSPRLPVGAAGAARELAPGHRRDA
jgi:uncharacterized pyridoxal phosphate-containing UPF0001 family protein